MVAIWVLRSSPKTTLTSHSPQSYHLIFSTFFGPPHVLLRLRHHPSPPRLDSNNHCARYHPKNSKFSLCIAQWWLADIQRLNNLRKSGSSLHGKLPSYLPWEPLLPKVSTCMLRFFFIGMHWSMGVLFNCGHMVRHGGIIYVLTSKKSSKFRRVTQILMLFITHLPENSKGRGLVGVGKLVNAMFCIYHVHFAQTKKEILFKWSKSKF